MNDELDFLHGLLIVALISAPFVTSRFFLEATKRHDAGHIVAGLVTAAALLLDLPSLTWAWLMFCVFGFALFLRQRFARLRSWSELTWYDAAKCVPFVFGIVGATWLVSGANGFGLLGYGRAFSYYASLHSHVLGWMIVGGVAVLANRASRFDRFYLVAVFASLISFALIALGIDGVPYIKPVGVFGITVLMGTSMVLFLVSVWRTSRSAFALGLVSLGGLVFTMTLAWQNEVGLALAPSLGARAMVSLHGVVNGVVVAPCFVLALFFSRRAAAGRAMTPTSGVTRG